MIEDNTLKITLVIYVVIAFLILYYKPSFLFQDKKKNILKKFGTGNKKTKTIFPLWFILFITAILIYIIVKVILIKNKSSVNYDFE